MARSSVVIRAAHAADSADIARLSDEAFGEYAKSPGHGSGSMLARSGAFGLVAEGDGRVVGFAIVRVAEGEKAWLDAIAVAPSQRGTGVGQALLEHAERASRARGCRQMGLATADSNLGALALFMRAGYRIAARKLRYYPRGQNAVQMHKTL